jgi:hypothetical protein
MHVILSLDTKHAQFFNGIALNFILFENVCDTPTFSHRIFPPMQNTHFPLIFLSSLSHWEKLRKIRSLALSFFIGNLFVELRKFSFSVYATLSSMLSRVSRVLVRKKKYTRVRQFSSVLVKISKHQVRCENVRVLLSSRFSW